MNQIGKESNCMYCNVKVLIWIVMEGYWSDRILNKHNGLQRDNMIWDGTETVPPSSMQMIEVVDRSLEVLDIFYPAHDTAVEGL